MPWSPSPTRSVTFVHADYEFTATYRVSGGCIEDLEIEHVPDCSDELWKAAKKAAQRDYEGQLDYNRTGW